MQKSIVLHFYNPRAEIVLLNGVIEKLTFFQRKIHEKLNFASKFVIHVIPDPRLFRYYRYFDFFCFFEFYQKHKTSFNLDVGRSFYMHLAENDTEIFTTFEKFTDSNGKYAGSQGYNKGIYFMVLDTGNIKLPVHLNTYIPKTFGRVLEKQDSLILMYCGLWR